MKLDDEFIKKIFNRTIEIKKKDDKIKLSKYSKLIPMYDIFTENVYPIKNTKIHYRLKDCHFRFITSEVKQWITNKYNKAVDKNIKKQFEINLKIIDNYDMDTLEKTSYETLYKYSPDFGLSISICRRESFHPYSSHLTPYYSRDELIKLGLNNKIIKKLEPESLVDKQLHYDICRKVSDNDISYKDIKSHMRHVIDKKCISWIVYYSLTGSYLFNDFLRNNTLISKYLLDGIYKLYDCIKTVEPFKNDYYFYRFLMDDKFLQKLKIGDTFLDKGFMSTTRDPFYSPGLEGDFGLILVKINIPKGKRAGILMENFSQFPQEEEFLLAPYSKFKLVSKDDKFRYYHTDVNFENKITKKYEFTFIGNIFEDKKFRMSDDIPEINLSSIEIMGKDRMSIFKLFLDKCNELGEFQFDERIFIAEYYDSTSHYSKFFKNKSKDGFSIRYYEEGYPVYSVEFGDKMIVNYDRRFNYYDSNENDVNIIKYTALFGKVFGYKKGEIYFPYENFVKFKDNYSNDKEYLYCNLYCAPLYDYFKNGNKYMDKNSFVKFKYGYFKLDKIKDTVVDSTIIKKLPKELQSSKLTWGKLFVEIVENHFNLYKRLEQWMNKYFDNICENNYVQLNVQSYLSSKGYSMRSIPDIEHITTVDRGSRFKLIYENSFRRV